MNPEALFPSLGRLPMTCRQTACHPYYQVLVSLKMAPARRTQRLAISWVG